MLTIGVVPYLNALPLYWTLRGREDVKIIAEVPAQLTARLQNGDCDVALIPVADHLRGAGEGLLGDAIIGATGEVRSVMFFSRKPLENIRSIALDTSSHSSVALTGVLFRDFYHLEPQVINQSPHLETMLQKADAALLIGDPALEVMQNPDDLFVYDLAREWQKFTGRSFVFAAWTARKGLENRAEVAGLLNQARDEGEALIPTIAPHTHSQLPPAVIQSYLTEAIEYRLTASHQAGFEEFARRLQFT